MGDYARYALYYAPPYGSALASFAASWLGWEPETGAVVARPEIEGLPESIETLTARPARYGFHATLRAPFRLKEGLTEKALTAAVFEFCEDEKPFDLPRLELTNSLGFVSLRPAEPSEDLSAFAMGCVRNFRGFAAPLSEEDLAKRRAIGLSDRQEEMLQRWGYPFVGEEFRFHMTLTRRLPAPEAETVMAALRPRLADALAEPAQVRELCLFGDPGPEGGDRGGQGSGRGGHFRVIRRFPLKG